MYWEGNPLDTFTIVRPEHLNHRGFLFGGQLLKWADEFSWVVAARDFRGYYLVTRGMDNIDFKTAVPNGSILRFQILPFRQGNTSVTYRTEVYSDEYKREGEKLVFSTHITFVSVDDDGEKQALPKNRQFEGRQ